MCLPHAAALFAHASLGVAVTAQYVAITESRLAAQQRQTARAARAGGAAAQADAAAEAAACSRLLGTLQAESFSAVTWAAAAAGQLPDLDVLEVDACLDTCLYSGQTVPFYYAVLQIGAVQDMQVSQHPHPLSCEY